MAKNAMIFSPHPRSVISTEFVVNDLRELLGRMGYPQDLIQCVKSPSIAKTGLLMNQADYVIATGGRAMVEAAYSSGTPAFGVGAGNSVAVIEESAPLDVAAREIMKAEINDWGSGCSTENSVAIQETVYEQMVSELKRVGGHLCNEEERKLLCQTLWRNGKLNPDCIIRPPQQIAKLSGFEVSEDCKFLMTEETELSPKNLFVEEKLSPIVALWKFKDLGDAINLVNTIHGISGAGHSCSIHSKDETHILEFASKTKTSRVAVNVCTGMNNAGGYNNKMPWTFSLGCGSWGGNAYSENNSFKHYYNTTWVYRTMPGDAIPPDKDVVYGELLKESSLFDNYPEPPII